MFWIVLCLAVLATLVGARALLRQFSAGLSATGLSDRFAWGLYIQAFLFLASLAGGVLFLAALSGLFLGKAVIAPPAGALSLGCLAGAGVMIVSDLGKPFRSALLAFGKNTGSTMTWDFYTFALCGLLSLAAVIYSLCRAFPGAVWSLLTLAASGAFLLMHVLLLLGRQKSRANHPFLAFDIFLRALWGGAAMLTLIDFDLSVVLLPLSLIVALGHLASLFAAQRPEKAPVFSWVDRLVLVEIGIAVLLLIGVYGKVSFLNGLAALAAILALAWEKTRLMRAFQAQSALPEPYSRWLTEAPYKPSSLEAQVCLGGLGLAVLVAMIILLLIR